jgi:hypothetical protein
MKRWFNHCSFCSPFENKNYMIANLVQKIDMIDGHLKNCLWKKSLKYARQASNGILIVLKDMGC